MTGITPFTGYDLLAGLVAGAALLAMVSVGDRRIAYDRHLSAAVAGLVAFAVGGPVATLLSPSLVHWVHGAAATLVVFGLYDPIANDLRTDRWETLLLEDPAQVRRPADWMRPMDDAVLDLFHSSELVLTPAIIAFNIDRSREEVNRRLAKLTAHGLVDRVERGKYRLTADGERYLRGEHRPETNDET